MVKPLSGLHKDVVVVKANSTAEVDFTASNPGSDALPLPPAESHGFRLHDALSLPVSPRRSQDYMVAFLKRRGRLRGGCDLRHCSRSRMGFRFLQIEALDAAGP